jgi:hypothetical protein
LGNVIAILSGNFILSAFLKQEEIEMLMHQYWCHKMTIKVNLRKVSETLVFNIRRRQLIESRIEKLKLQYHTKELSVHFKSAVNVLNKRLKHIDRQYKNAWMQDLVHTSTAVSILRSCVA